MQQTIKEQNIAIGDVNNYAAAMDYVFQTLKDADIQTLHIR